ncbi:hypothetical protein OC845_004734 [Tilletia horrida]|nr:hypothetical protein OC845_004734 [Tilletia horrida]
MDVNGGREAAKVLTRAGNRNTSAVVVPLAGHHTYLDNPDACNTVVEGFLRN